MTETVQLAILTLPAFAWTAAVRADGKLRGGGDAAELTGILTAHGVNLTGNGWPPVTRLIVKRERPHLGAQLSLSDIDSYRFLKPSGADCVAHHGEPRAATDRFARGGFDHGAQVIGTTRSLCPHGARGDGWEYVVAAQRRYSGRS